MLIITVVFILGLLGLEVGALQSNGTIRVAVDSHILFGYTGLTSRLNNCGIFDFRIINFKEKRDTFFHEDVDIVVLDRPLQYHGLYSILSDPKPLSFAIANLDILKQWDNKLFFKTWLHGIGLGDFAARTYDATNISFPCILKVVGQNAIKDHVTSGKSVFLIHDMKSLNETVHSQITLFNVHKAPRSRRQYFLEQPLLGRFEGTVYSSAFEGEALAVRCMVRLTKQDNKNAHRVLDKFGFTIHATPCGNTIVEHVNKMVTASNYTGTFCMNFKVNETNSRPIYIENNPRICGTAVRNPQLFISLYLPLTFAVQRRKCMIIQESNCPWWYRNTGGILRWIVHVEKILASIDYHLLEDNSTRYAANLHRHSEFNYSTVIRNNDYFFGKNFRPLSLKMLGELHKAAE